MRKSPKALANRVVERVVIRDQTQVLVRRGLRLGSNVRIHGGVNLDAAHVHHITIGDDVTIAPRAQILAHDASSKKLIGLVKVAKTTVGDRVFIGAGAIVMPGVTVNDDAIVGAGSVVTKDVPQGTIVAGNPARPIGKTAEYKLRLESELSTSPTFDASYTARRGATAAQRAEMNEQLGHGFGFIE